MATKSVFRYFDDEFVVCKVRRGELFTEQILCMMGGKVWEPSMKKYSRRSTDINVLVQQQDYRLDGCI